MSTCSRLSSAFVKSCVVRISCVSHDLCGRKPYVLVRVENVIGIEVFHHLAGEDVFHHFTQY